jgi:peptidoglycan/LPS O-acetylase OafA/YrhL
MRATTIIQTTHPARFACAVAASGIALTTFVAPVPTERQGRDDFVRKGWNASATAAFSGGTRNSLVRFAGPTRRTSMTRTATFLTIALVSSLATPLVVSASTAPKSDAPATVMVATAAVATPAPVATSAVLAQPVQAEAGCARRVRVVYQGYSPVNGGTCTAAR